jgi:hypothetical protein
MYSDLYLRKRRSPLTAVIGVIVVVAFVGFGAFMFTYQPTQTRASKKSIVQQEIVNLSYNQAGIYWQSEEKQTGWVVYGESADKLRYTASDERDSENEKALRQLHFIMLKGLKPDTTYYYQIVNGNEVIDNNGKPFEFKTVKQFSAVGATKPAYGKVVLKTGEPAENALVFIRKGDSYPLVSITKSTGEWLIPLQFVIEKESRTPVALNQNDELSVYITNDELMNSGVKILVKRTNPFPQSIVLGDDYTFLQEETEEVLSATTARKSEASVAETIDVLFPRDQAVIPGSKPLIKGTAVPRSIIDLSLTAEEGTTLTMRTVADERGNWLANLIRPLTPGTYYLSMSTVDAQQQSVVLNRTFTIAKSGEQVLGDATSPGALSPTVVLQATEKPSPTTAVVPTTAPATEPTIGLSPTVEPTRNPAELTTSVTVAVTPTMIPNDPTATPVPPISGGNGLLFTFTALGLLIVGVGAIIML